MFAVTVDGVLHKQWPWLNGVESLPVVTRKKKAAEPSEVDAVVSLETKILAKHMGIVHHCSVVRYGPGEPRVPGNISIQTQGQSWVVVVNDVDSFKRLKVVAATLDAALSGANVLVQEPEAPWEDAPWLDRDAGKKKRK